MNYLNTAFIRIAFFFIAGILAGFHIDIPLSLLFLTFAPIFILFLLFYFRAGKLFMPDALFGIASFLLFFFIGLITTQLHLPENQPRHYTNLISRSSNTEAPPLLVVSVSEELKPDLYHNKFVAEIEKSGEKPTHGKILILLPKDSLNLVVQVDDRLVISSQLVPIPAPLNPHQFNYRKFMENRGILMQTSISSENFKKLRSDDFSLKGRAEKWRSGIVESLQDNNFKKDELAIIQALLLGQKQDISEEIYNNYAAAGVIHILAVSGLHVGIILLLLHRLSSPLNRSRHGRFIRTLLLISLLWLFALLAGLSPSVVRAVTMFSFVAVGLQIKRRTNVLNTLFMSMMVLLLIRPQFIFEVGFQLSYLAVISIVLLQPPLYKLLRPQNRFTKYMWGLLTVTIAAQAGVLPVSLFYFHQFPGLFFVSNLVILPFMGIILAMGIIVIFLALMNFLPAFITDLYGFLIESLNTFVEIVAAQEDFLLRDIPFSGSQAVAFYVLLAALFLLLKSISFNRIVLVLTAVIMLQIVFYAESYSSSSEDLVIFHKSRNTMIGKKKGKALILTHNSPEALHEQHLIRNYLVGEQIARLETEKLQHVYSIGDEILMVVDSLSIYDIPGLKPHYLLLMDSPRLNLDRLLELHQPKAIIADGSNYKSLTERWKATCSKKGVLFHVTREDGAFILKR